MNTKIEYHAARTTLFCAIAELSVNDLYYELDKEKKRSKHITKRKIELCMNEANRLKKCVESIPTLVVNQAKENVGEELGEAVDDSIYNDVAFIYDLLQVIEAKIGDDKEKRIKLRALIFNSNI